MNQLTNQSQPTVNARPRVRLGLKSLLILMTLVSICAMMAGLFITGVWIGEPASSAHRLNLMPFIFASSMAPVGVPLAIYWGLRIYESLQPKNED